MNIEILEKQVDLLTVLVNGCKKHPAYRAIRPATGNCAPCVKMWQARIELALVTEQSEAVGRRPKPWRNI